MDKNLKEKIKKEFIDHVESVFLSHALVLGFCVKLYCDQNHIINTLKGAVEVNLGQGLINTLQKAPRNRLEYAVLRDTVTPVGTPMTSAMAPAARSVLQRMTLYKRGIDDIILHMSTNEVPFNLQNDGVQVEVIDAFSSRLLDLEMVYNHFQPSPLSFLERIFGYSRGHQLTEEVLREGSYITAIGEIELGYGGSLRIQPSKVGPLFLISGTKSTVLRRMLKFNRRFLFIILLFGSVGVALLGVIGRKMLKKRREEEEQRECRCLKGNDN